MRCINYAKKIIRKIDKNQTINIPIIKEKNQIDKQKKLIHIAAFTYGNAGDAILPTAVRDSLEIGETSNFNWTGVHAHTTINDELIAKINQQKGVVIGGGGLFLRDTNPNNLSGWQWSCSIDSLKKIKVPIALFAVGYNRFRGQEDFSSLFKEHVNVLAEKSPFIGLRNHGSIESVKNYIKEENHYKIKFQPCPTTIISKLYPILIDAENIENSKPFIAVNCAFDRSVLRYGQQIGGKLSSIAKALKKLSNDFDIRYYSHVYSDEYFLPYLDCYGIKYQLVKLNNHPRKIIELYTTPSLTIGMRGHAQMIPFGCGTPILSIVSHEKMRYFIEDINHPEWGIDINDPNFEVELYNKAMYILSNQDIIKSEIEAAQQKLFDITNDNVVFIKEKFKI